MEMERKTVNVTIDGRSLDVEEGGTILQAAREFGIHIPTLCYMDHLSPYGGCRICVVEISNNGGGKTFIDTSCTYEVREGMVIQTQSPRIIRARKMLAELLVASAPNVKIAQDIAAAWDCLKSDFQWKIIGVSSAVSASGCATNRWMEKPSDLLEEEWVGK
jgi:predicted molibdopterin-dependent oxidoreductase YjgC